MKKVLIVIAGLGMVMVLTSVPASVVAKKDASWILDLSGEGKFFDLPYPSELRRQSDGSIDMDGFPNHLGLKMVDRIRDAIANGYGFSTAPVIYFRFAGGIGESNLPTPKESLGSGSPIFLVDIDPDSPERGNIYPLTSKFYAPGPALMKSRATKNLLAIMPLAGFVLKENTLYAAGVLRSLGGKDGAPLPKSPALIAIAEGRAPEGALGGKALDVYGPALKALTDIGMNISEICALTVFRTGDPTERMVKLFDGVKDLPTLAFETALQKTREYDLYTVLEGAVMMPQFQDGTPPFGHGRGGRTQFDSSGKPVIQRLERVPVCITVPKKNMPAGGFPVMIYVHGTAGISTQVVDRGAVTEDSPEESHGFVSDMIFGKSGMTERGAGPSLVLAHHGIAALGAAQPVNGERGYNPQMITFYNFLSPEALRDNLLQASAEASMLLRLLQKIEIDPALCPGTDTGGGPVRFDPELIFGMGQSLGSLILGPWGGVETDVKVLFPSGNGAYWTLFIAEGNAFDFDSLKKKGVGLTESVGMDRHHPYIMGLANVLAPGDPYVYQPHYFKDPLPGRAPKHVWISFGLYDHYFPPVSQNAAILCTGMDFAGPIGEPSTGPMLELAGLDQLDYPIKLNKGEVTAVAVQYPQWGPLDGHHINYQRQDTKYQYGCFLESYIKDGAPTLYAPKDQWDAKCGE